MIDIKKIREERGLTQSQLADALNNNKINTDDDEIVSQEMVSRYEKDWKNIPAWFAYRIIKFTGENPIDIKTELKELEVDDYLFKKKVLLKSVKEIIKKNKTTEKTKNENSYDEEYERAFKNLENCISTLERKPRVAFIGNSDTGKSSTINSLIGKDILPAQWQPHTSISIFIRHSEDKPDYIKNDVTIFKPNVEGKNFRIDKINNEEYYAEWSLETGNYNVLKEYGIRDENGNCKDYSGAVIYVNSAILKNLEIIDLPGFNTDRIEDDLIYKEEVVHADVTVFLSRINGFIDGTEINYLKDGLKNLKVLEKKNENDLKPLNNFYVLATHGDIIKTASEREQIIDSAAKRVYNKTIPQNYWDYRCKISGYEYSIEEIKNRIFPYSNTLTEIGKSFREDLVKLLKEFGEMLYLVAKQEIKKAVETSDESLKKELDGIDKLLNDRDNIIKALKERDSSIGKTNQEKELERKMIVDKIRDYKKNDIEKVKNIYEEIVNEKFLEEELKRKAYENKKIEKEMFISYINDLLSLRIQDILEASGKEFSKNIDDFIETKSKANNFNFKGFGFDYKRAFFSGLGGVGILGAFTIWASIVAAGSNLGAYILIAQGVSFLSALGISVGGTAAAATGIAAIGGPITIGIALAIISALALYSLLGINWQKKFSSLIVKEYEKAKAKKQYEDLVQKFWEDTENAFKATVDKIEKEFDEYINNLRETINNFNEEEIREKKERAEKMLNFLKQVQQFL